MNEPVLHSRNQEKSFMTGSGDALTGRSPRSRHKLWWVVGLLLAALIAVGIWFLWLSPTVTLVDAPKKTAEQFMQAVQSRDLKQATKYASDPDDTRTHVLYSLIIQRQGENYQLESQQTRELEGRTQHSYIFQAQDEGSEKFIRVLVEPLKNNEWRVAQVFANSAKPSAFPTAAPTN